MSQFVIINLGQGNWQTGFPTVIARIGTTGRSTAIQSKGSLPPAPELAELYNQWQKLYQALSQQLRLRRSLKLEFEDDEDYLPQVSRAEFDRLSQQLEDKLNAWLESRSFRKIDQQLRTQLLPSEKVQVIIEVENEQLRRLPWHLWHFFEDYPKAEVALSPQEYEEVAPNPSKGRILAILGHARGIDIQKDREILEDLPGAETVFGVEPQREELDRWLWDERGWDILFFAGHSSSEKNGQTGQIEINPGQTLSIAQLKNALRAAIARGLKLAIFNSCDGLGLARELADLNLPQLIVMREPVPDRVAQEFLKHFLSAFAGGKPFHLAVRQGREKLQGLESDFPGASWLPVLCQNPSTTLPPWDKLFPSLPKSPEPPEPPPEPESQNPTLAFCLSLAVAALTIAVGFLGVFQPLELKAFDTFLRLRPSEGDDPRLLVIQVTAKDVQAQPSEDRKAGSLSNRSLQRLLLKLEQYQPRIVALDIYRTFPVEPEFEKLRDRWRNDDRLIAVCKVGDDADNRGIAPPRELAPNHPNFRERVGFSDLVTDSDGVLRRQLLGMAPPMDSLCPSQASLALQVALRYLEQEKIEASLTEAKDLQIGSAVFETLEANSGGYRHLDNGGYQVLLNYRATDAIASQLTLGEIIDENQLTPELVRDRIVLIGTTDKSFGDFHRTPYNRTANRRTPGVIVQAHMVSQILSAVLDERPLLWYVPEWGEGLWILAWSGVGGWVGWRSRSAIAIAFLSGAVLVILSSSCYLILWKTGGWLPVGSTAFSVIAAAGTVSISQRHNKSVKI
ncbi:MAG: CHASE2 domain-containing protein [Cyanobacteriota bacterium]|nr:CHASE2 domain-containing protein [Cyanobacteriota bacterium]